MREKIIIRSRLYCWFRALGGCSSESVFVGLVILIDVGATLAGGPGGGWTIVLLVTVEAVVISARDRVRDADYTVARVSWELKNKIKSFLKIYTCILK